VYTFSSPPTVIPSPRIRVSPPRFSDAVKKSVTDSVDKNGLPGSDDSCTEHELENSQTTAVSVSPAKLGSYSSVNEKLPSATVSRLSPRQQTVRHSSLREIPEDEIRRSGVSNI